MTAMRRILLFCLCLLLAFSCRERRSSYPLLDELDGYLEARPVYETRCPARCRWIMCACIKSSNQR